MYQDTPLPHCGLVELGVGGAYGEWDLWVHAPVAEDPEQCEPERLGAAVVVVRGGQADLLGAYSFGTQGGLPG